MNQKQFETAFQIGQTPVLVYVSQVEPFSGNALYYSRGTGTMGQLKTVKEVCALTGLTGKHLYYFHHENVVRAVAYANYSVEGNDGYKLYDEAGVEKLQQIALFYQLGLKRNEIRDLMLAPDYDSTLVWEKLLDRKRAERKQIDWQIEALDYLRKTGMQNDLTGILRGRSLEELGKMLVDQRGKTNAEFLTDPRVGV